ncbi:MAG: thiamine-phosphate kinase [Proteobacteria bacterium]|nr:thiamine-phosphate kinase [Pseudomonadota bacterium]MBU1717190.1 thiamine-phosphate kinase [Pseudomonadota bacterium]
MTFSELDIISRISAMVPGQGSEVIKGLGDDCAVIRMDNDRLWLATADTLVENVHFDYSWHPPGLLGRKTASVNLSDIAGMGGRPSFALLSLALPVSVQEEWLTLFMQGFLAVLHEHDALLVGGDTVKSNHDAVFSVTVLGQIAADRVLYRSGAKPGDLVWVSGELGVAAAGLELCRQGRPHPEDEAWQKLVLAHLDPTPEVELGLLLAESGMVSAMMDTSDGLATDLAHLCEQSGIGSEIIAAKLPMPVAMAKVAACLGGSALNWALSGGEDYRLLFTSSPDNSATLPSLVKERMGREIYCIGTIVDGSGVVLIDGNQRRDITYKGYDHFAK